MSRRTNDGPPKIIKEYVNKQADPTKDASNKWWLEPEEIHSAISVIVKQIESNQQYRRLEHLKFARLYSNLEMLGFASTLYSRSATENNPNNRITLNVIKSCVDTVCSKISKNKPRPLFITQGGDFTLQRKAKLLTKYLDGLFDIIDLYHIAQQVFRDACVFGTGAIKIYIQDSQVKVERVFIEELIVDDAEGIYGTPSQMHQKRYVFRDQLIDAYPEHEQEIRAATSSLKGDAQVQTSCADQIQVTESWHLPSGPNADDGRHAITIDNCTLFQEPYKKDYFPIITFRWSERLLGFFGAGLAEELVGIQIEINKILRSIQRAIHLMGNPRIYVENSSKVSIAQLNNEIGAIVKYTGVRPEVSNSPIIAPEIYSHLENLYRKAYEITGISMLSASAKKPDGLNSGIALREYQDVETERFVLIGQRFENFILDIAKVCIDLTRDIYKEDKNVSVRLDAGKEMQTIDWKDINLKDEDFMMRMFPVSILPTTPAGKLQTVQELVQAGFVSQSQAISLLDFPDLDDFISLQTASLDDAKMLIERMINEGDYIPPEPFMDLQLTLQLTQSAYLRAKTQRVPEDRLQLLRNFMEDIKTLQTPQPPPDAAAPPPPGDPSPAPQAVPASPPVSQLLPNAPQA